MKVRLLSHTDLDGYGCNIVANVFIGENNVVATNHNYGDIDKKFMEFLHSNEVNDFDLVLITDLSLTDETAERVNGYLNSGIKLPQIVLLDHHASAERLNKYEWCYVTNTEMDRGVEVMTCGTMLLYNWFLKNVIHDEEKFFEECGYNDCSLKCFVEMVRDWDTWEWKNNAGSWGETAKELNNLFYMFGKDRFIPWAMSKIDRTTMGFTYEWAEQERLLLDVRSNEIKSYIKAKEASMTLYSFGNYLGGVVFADRFTSELGNEICELHPELDLVAIIDMSTQAISFRSSKYDVDVSMVAEMYGGGGHVHSAGCRLKAHTSERVAKIILDTPQGG